jgi:hypothetical protein
MNDYLKSAESGKMRAGKGDLIKHLKGKRLTRQGAIKAKCYDCNGMGESDECDMEHCSLYPYSPYARKSPAVHPATTRRSRNAK